MTNKEAINLLDNLIGMVEDNQNSDYDTALKMAIDALKQTERKKGKWIRIADHDWECSECKKDNVFAYTYSGRFQDYFCPNCGADMWSNEENKWVSEIHERLMDETGGKAVRKNEHWGRGDNNEID